MRLNSFQWDTREVVEKPKSQGDISIKKMHNRISGHDYLSFTLRRNACSYLTSERIMIGLSEDGKSIGFIPTESEEGYKLQFNKDRSSATFTFQKMDIVEKYRRFIGEYNARFTEDGVLYILPEFDKELVALPENKSEVSDYAPINNSLIVLQSSPETGYFTDPIACKFCGAQIRYRINPGFRGIPVNDEVRYFCKKTNGPCRFVDAADGRPYRGVMYSKHYNGTTPGYLIHTASCIKGGNWQ